MGCWYFEAPNVAGDGRWWPDTIFHVRTAKCLRSLMQRARPGAESFLFSEVTAPVRSQARLLATAEL